MVTLFWNINRNQIADLLGRACGSYGVDILLLAEADDRSWDILRELNRGDEYRWKEIAIIRSRVRMFTRYPVQFVQPIYDDARVSIKNVSLPELKEVLVVGVHLASKLCRDSSDKEFEVRQLQADLLESEARVGHKNTLVIGDFNMAPFEPPMVAADGLHAVMDRKVAQRVSRQVAGKSYEFMFNPMWSRLGDESSGPAGTYYFSESRPQNYFWYALDQVLMRPGLISAYEAGSLSVLTEVDGRSLLRSEMPDPEISDQLPLRLELGLESNLNV
jgi:endonuclease/exonuclease/phosphatase family metal-dependent hydrolase